jgi:hypothetical protein
LGIWSQNSGDFIHLVESVNVPDIPHRSWMYTPLPGVIKHGKLGSPRSKWAFKYWLVLTILKNMSQWEGWHPIYYMKWDI